MFNDEMFSSDSNTRGLSDVFRRSEATKQGSDSFSYKAPVQPRKAAQSPAKAAAASTAVRPSVLNFCQVTAYKHVSGTPTDMGKVGAAVVGGIGCSTAQIMLYKSTKDYLCVADINGSFRYTVAGDHYASFYGNDQVAWSIRFDNADTERAFAIHVAIVQFLVGGMQTMVTLDEVAPKSGHVVGKGDMLGVKYTAWLLDEKGACGKQLDTNTDKSTFYKMILGERSQLLAGWHDALMGMRKNGKRLVVLPPSLAYGEAGVPPSIPANSSVVFELEISKLKSAANQLNTSLDSAAPTPASSIPPSPLQKPQEYQMVLAAPPAAATAAPAQAPAPAPAAAPAPAPAPAPVAEPQAQAQPQGQSQAQPHFYNALTMYNPAQAQQPQQPQPQMFQPAPAYAAMAPPPAPQQSGLTTQDTIQMMMEDRQFRSDLKATIAAFGTKLEEVTNWVKELRNPPSKDENVEMSGIMVIQTMQKLVDQTERYRFETEDKVQTITSLTEKVRELQDSNQRYVEDTQKMMTMRDEAHQREMEQAKVQYDALNQEKGHIQAELAQATVSLQTVQGQLVAQTNATAQVQGELARSREDARSIAAALEETRTLVARADERSAKDQQALQEEQKAKAELSSQIDALQRKIEEQKQELANAEQLAETQKARAASDLANAQHELEQKTEELNAQISKLQKQIAKMEKSAPKVEQIEAEAEKKWKRKAELAIEEARIATDDEHRKKIKEWEKKCKTLRTEKDELEEQLEEARAQVRKAQRAANDAAPMQLSVSPARATKVRVKKVVVETGVPVEAARAKFAEVRQKHHEEMVETVKNGMNGVFHALKELIDADESYDGSAVLNAIKRTIKKSTLEYLGQLEDEEGNDAELEAMFKEAEERAAKAKEAAAEESDASEEEAEEEEEKHVPPKKLTLEEEEDEDKHDEEDDDDKNKKEVEEEEEEEKPQPEEQPEVEKETEEDEEKPAEPPKTEVKLSLEDDEDDDDEKPAEKEEKPEPAAPEEEEPEDKPTEEPEDKPEDKPEDEPEDKPEDKPEVESEDEGEKNVKIDEDALLGGEDKEEEEHPAAAKEEAEETVPEVSAEPEVKPDSGIATKALFSDDEEDDEDDIHIPPPAAAEPTPAAPTQPAAAGTSSKLFEDEDDDWGADDDPLSFLKKK